MKKIILLVAMHLVMLALSISLFSCSESDGDSNEITNTSWSYKEPIFNFEYAEDSIKLSIPTMETPMVLTPEAVRMLGTSMANEKMSQYFKGIKFGQAQDMVIEMRMANLSEDSLKASYILKDKYFVAIVDTADLHRLTGQSLNIPPISFNYRMEGNYLKLYMDTEYIKLILAQILPTVVDFILSTDDGVVVPDAAKAQMTAYLTSIIKNVTKVEIGVILQKD